MPKAKRNSPPAADVPSRLDPALNQDDVTSTAPAPGEDTATGNKISRVSFAIKDDGSGFDFDSMRDSNKQKLAELVQKDYAAILEQGGMSADSGGSFDGISIANVAAAIDSITNLNAIGLEYIAPMFIKNPWRKDENQQPTPIKFAPGLCSLAFKLTAEQHAEIDPRALRLAQRFAPKWLKDNADWVMLIQMYGTYTFQNAMKAIQWQLQKDREAYEKAMAALPKQNIPPQPPPGFDGGIPKGRSVAA